MSLACTPQDRCPDIARVPFPQALQLRRGSDLEAQVEVLDRQADAVGHSPYISQPDTLVQLVKRIMSAEFGEAVDMSEQYRERQMVLGGIFQSLVKGV